MSSNLQDSGFFERIRMKSARSNIALATRAAEE